MFTPTDELNAAQDQDDSIRNNEAVMAADFAAQEEDARRAVLHSAYDVVVRVLDLELSGPTASALRSRIFCELFCPPEQVARFNHSA